jgi:hypothetical protein
MLYIPFYLPLVPGAHLRHQVHQENLFNREPLRSRGTGEKICFDFNNKRNLAFSLSYAPLQFGVMKCF